MGQGIGGDSEAPAVAGDAGGREPIGRYIAQQRRLRGIELEELAARTRIPRRSLERLEAGAFDLSPDGFSRGFVRTVAEAIGLDPDDAVARMLPEPDATQRGSPRSGRVLGALAALAVLAGIALAVRALVLAPTPPAALAAHGELPVRRDFVRALAEAQGIDAAALTARAAVLVPLPPEEPATTAVAAADSANAATPDAASEASAHSSARPTAAPAPRVATASEHAATPAAPAPALGGVTAQPKPASTGPSAAPPASASAVNAPSVAPADPSLAPVPTPRPDAEAHD